ncbi:hypothetical protein DOM21_03050 [Bacteriovorax stolpii]|uniref:hypothetical protein n=1 Tax=Bacteriovorax stolpii TaxID=960 RepID=UPI00115A676F|nr:hypothetical protein [Bacteriovorax stolpii]QDK40448.1 hypothetical protein DOM21_03050 [Bacteriovorax stolpii]
MKELHLTNIHIISSIIAICALIPLFAMKKGGRGHIFLGYAYTLFSFITIGVILTGYGFFYTGRYLNEGVLPFSTGRLSVLVEAVLYLTQLLVGVLFIQKGNWPARFKTQKTFMGLNLAGIIAALLLIYNLYLEKSTLSAAFCGVVVLNHVVLFIFGIFIFEMIRKNPERKEEGLTIIHSSQITSSAILFVFMGIAGTLGNLIFGMDLKFNMKTTLVFPMLDVLMIWWFAKRHPQFLEREK